MHYRPLGNTGYQVSAVVYGGIISSDEGQAASDRYVSWALDRGINYFDVAPTYRDAEEKLGQSLRAHRRDVYLACKTTERGLEGASREMERSMQLLHTDYFDLYQLHAMTTPEDVERAFAKDGVMELLVKRKQEGVVRKIGFSAHAQQAALQCLALYPFDTVLFPMNYQLDMGEGIGGEVARRKEQLGFGLLGMKTLIERAWRDESEREASPYPKSWCKPFDRADKALRIAAMRYTLAMGADVLVPPGNYENFSFMVDHVDQVLQTPLTGEDKALLAERYAMVSEQPFFLKNNGGWEK